jgi:homoserine O-succinyltransferase/O-acetyltransferase
MPLEIESARSRAALRKGVRRSGAQSTVVVGLVNNMPDAALEATEAQFARLLSAAGDAAPVRLRFYFIPEVPRGPAGLAHVNCDRYRSIDELYREPPPDALIVTGTEPVAPLLSDEPYWERLRELLQWAQANTTSSIWSCLAAHAAVELLDGIRRRRLEQKRCGVFAHDTLTDQPLLKGIATPLHTPHSRWNELPVDALRDAGYTIVSASAASGADMFTKQADSLLVFFQGHPEYEDTTLLREYRRDVGRFLRGQQAHYPTLPHGYFPPAALELLGAFEARARAEPTAELLADFPMTPIAATLRSTWSAGATGIYRNWLALLAGLKKNTARLARSMASPSGS